MQRGEEVVIYDEIRAGEEGEWITSLSIVCADLPQAERAFAKLSATALDLSHDSVSQMVSKHRYDTDDEEERLPGEEYHDDMTLVKVLRALEGLCFSLDTSTGIIHALQNAGILFRERR